MVLKIVIALYILRLIPTFYLNALIVILTLHFEGSNSHNMKTHACILLRRKHMLYVLTVLKEGWWATFLDGDLSAILMRRPCVKNCSNILYFPMQVTFAEHL